MKHCLLIMTLIASVSANAQSQGPSQVANENPVLCGDVKPPGRPSLKRRQPAPTATSENREAVTEVGLSDCKETDQRAAVKIKFEGLRDISESDLIKILREEAAFPADSIPGEDAIGKAHKVIRDWLQARGYMNSSVEIMNDYESQLVRIVINEGDRFKIQDIRVVGSKTFSSQELSSQITECLGRFQDSRWYDANLFGYCSRNVVNHLRSRGYLQAEFSEPLPELTAKGVRLEVHVKEGPLYRLGDIFIDDADDLSVDYVRSLLKTKKGEIVDGEAIGKWLFEDLKSIYARMGYIQYMAEPTPIFRFNDNGTEGGVDFRVTIEEGKRFNLGSIKFVGFDLPDGTLRNLFLIRDGEIFNQELFEQGIKRINETNLLTFVDKDKDVEFTSDEEVGCLSILVRMPKSDSTPPDD